MQLKLKEKISFKIKNIIPIDNDLYINMRNNNVHRYHRKNR